MKRFRYIIDPNAKRRTGANTVPLLANNQLPPGTAVCFRVQIRKDTDTRPCGGYSMTHDTRRLEELGIMLRIRRNGDWETRALSPDDNRTLQEISDGIAEEMRNQGYTLDITDGEGYIPAGEED